MSRMTIGGVPRANGRKGRRGRRRPQQEAEETSSGAARLLTERALNRMAERLVRRGHPAGLVILDQGHAAAVARGNPELLDQSPGAYWRAPAQAQVRDRATERRSARLRVAA